MQHNTFFLRQQWLRERGSIIRWYVRCLSWQVFAGVTQLVFWVSVMLSRVMFFPTMYAAHNLLIQEDFWSIYTNFSFSRKTALHKFYYSLWDLFQLVISGCSLLFRENLLERARRQERLCQLMRFGKKRSTCITNTASAGYSGAHPSYTPANQC